MYQDMYRSVAEDKMRDRRKKAKELQLYLKIKKEKKAWSSKKFLGITKGA